MAPLIDVNTQLRKAAKNAFDECFYELIVNSAFGKTMDSKRNWKKLTIVHNENELMQKLCQILLIFFQIIDY